MENLELNGLKAKNIFELKIKTLKTLDIYNSENIYINSDTELSLKKLAFSNGKISESLLKLPQLEYLDTSRIISPSIDFKSLKNLKKIKMDSILSLIDIYDKIPSVNKLILFYDSQDIYYPHLI